MAKALKYILILIAVFLVGFFLIWLIRPDIIRRGYLYVQNQVIKCEGYDQKDYSAELKDRLKDYGGKSRLTGIPLCRNDQELLGYVDRGDLLKVAKGEGYIIDNLHHSYPYLTPQAALLLEDIAENFRVKISGTRVRNTKLIVTSMTRTIDSNKTLGGRNGNASSNSPHLNGNAFDITYVRFRSPRLFLTPCDREFLKAALSDVIWQLRKDKRCWVTYEKGQHCFHMVAK